MMEQVDKHSEKYYLFSTKIAKNASKFLQAKYKVRRIMACSLKLQA